MFRREPMALAGLIDREFRERGLAAFFPGRRRSAADRWVNLEQPSPIMACEDLSILALRVECTS